MTDKEIFDIVDMAIGRYANTTNTFIATELDSVRHEIKGVKDEFHSMNGRLRDVCQWKDQHEGEMKAQEKGIHKHIQIAGVILAFLLLCSGVYFGFKRMGAEINTIKKSYENYNSEGVR